MNLEFIHHGFSFFHAHCAGSPKRYWVTNPTSREWGYGAHEWADFFHSHASFPHSLPGNRAWKSHRRGDWYFRWFRGIEVCRGDRCDCCWHCDRRCDGPLLACRDLGHSHCGRRSDAERERGRASAGLVCHWRRCNVVQRQVRWRTCGQRQRHLPQEEPCGFQLPQLAGPGGTTCVRQGGWDLPHDRRRWDRRGQAQGGRGSFGGCAEDSLAG